MNLAPICLFTYNRLEETKQTIEALKKNYLASESELFIFSDGPKNDKVKSNVDSVRKYLHSVTGFKIVSIFESVENNGLANSIISGVSKIIEEYGKVIVLEDDLITSPNFLNFMNQAIDFYVGNTKIFSISGYSMQLPALKNMENDFYLGFRASSWGWGTWENRWSKIDWEVKEYKNFKKDLKKQFSFMRGGSDMPFMLKQQMSGKIDSWAIRWCFYQFQKNQFTVFPSKSKVISIGFGESATHTKNTKRFQTLLDKGEQRTFIFDATQSVNTLLIKEFRNKFSVLSRLKDKLL